MPSICDPCEDFTCCKDIPYCAETLDIGEATDDDGSGEYTIYVYYTMGAEEVLQAQDYDLIGSYGGQIVLDLTSPSSEFYNPYNGLYRIWATNRGAGITERLTLTKDGINAEIWGVRFKRVEGITFTDLEIIPLQ